MSAISQLLSSLASISRETTEMLQVLDDHASTMRDSELRDVKRRVFEMRAQAQGLFDWINSTPLEPAREDVMSNIGHRRNRM